VAQIVIEQWRIEYNTKRPHSALAYRPPAPAAPHRSSPSKSGNAFRDNSIGTLA
jgi:transposase InsO family protein